MEHHDGGQRERELGDGRARLADRLPAPQEQEVAVPPESPAWLVPRHGLHFARPAPGLSNEKPGLRQWPHGRDEGDDQRRDAGPGRVPAARRAPGRRRGGRGRRGSRPARGACHSGARCSGACRSGACRSGACCCGACRSGECRSGAGRSDAGRSGGCGRCGARVREEPGGRHAAARAGVGSAPEVALTGRVGLGWTP